MQGEQHAQQERRYEEWKLVFLGPQAENDVEKETRHIQRVILNVTEE